MGLIADIHRDLEFGALQLIVEYRARLHVEAVKLCGDETQADDLVFRTFEQVLAKVDSYKVDMNLFGWMKSIMENIHLNDVRRPVDRRTKAVPSEELEQCAGADWSTDEQLLKNSDSEALREALHGLDPKYHKVLLMRYYQELSMRQIAEILCLPLGTVTRRVQIAHELLAGKLRAEFGKAKKPLAVLLAALLGVGSLFGAWQAGLLAPFLAPSVETPQSVEANQRGEAESFPLQEETASTQTQPQPETDLAQEKTVSTQTESKESQNMNMKTVKTLAATAVVAANAVVSNAATSAGYVQDGLIAMWDGYENDGAGGHATELTEWKDTTGTYSFVFDENAGITVDGAALVFPSAQAGGATLSAADTVATFEQAKDGTLEIVLISEETTAANAALQSSSKSCIGLGAQGRGSATAAPNLRFCTVNRPIASYNWSAKLTTFAVTYSGMLSQTAWANAEKLATSSNGGTGASSKGETNLGKGAFGGRIYAIRLYSKPLTPEEIELNHDIDYERFVRGNFAPALPFVKIKNYDDDLATVYVNGVAATNGQRIAVDGTVAIDLRDFRSDYYFRFAPETQVDRQLGFGHWEGVPSGYEQVKTATFTVDRCMIITPIVDVKGYCWTIQDNELQNELFRWNFGKDDVARTVTMNKCITNKLGLTENTLTLDIVQRVLYDNKLYTVTAFDKVNNVAARPAFGSSRICQVAFAPNFRVFGDTITDGSGFVITNFFGVPDLKAPIYLTYCFHYSPAQLKGPATNFVAKHAISFAANTFNGKSGITGPIELDSVRSIANSFNGCSGLTEVNCTSPYLTTIGAAFSGCTKIGKVTIGSSILESVDISAFPASVTNFIFLGAAPSQTVAGNIVGKMTAPVAKTTRFTVDGDRADWWALAKQPNADEIAAGLPANCMGVFADASGIRKAWVVSNKPLDGILVETDMTKIENEGYTMHTGLALGDELTLTAPEGMSQCDLQHVEDGVWKTYDTQVGERVTYKHGGELTRVVWRIDGVTLDLSTTGYKGTLRVEVKSGGLVASSNIYSRGSEVWVTAVGSAERPRSTLRQWTGVPAGQETNETVKLVLNGDMPVNALFRPLEWVYDPATKTITDGEYTSGARANALIGDDGMSFGSFTCADYELWLDLAIPIYNPEDPTKDYWIAEITQNNNTTWKRVRFGPHIVSLTASLFVRDAVLDEVEDFAKVQVESLADYFFYNYGEGRPLQYRTYEAEYFYPPTLKQFGRLAFNDTAKLQGKITVGLTNLANFTDSLLPLCAAVTNWIFTAENLPPISLNTSFFAPSTVTFACTNLSAGAWMFRYGELKDLIFLAHAPSAAVMNTMTTSYLKNTNTVIHCSKYAPGWKELRMKGYSSCKEWAARPAGCWGVYQTDNGQKRFYLVQKDSKYDKRNGFSVLVK